MARTPTAAELGLPDTRVVLVGRPGCHLCDEARTVIRSVLDELGADPGALLAEVAIDTDPRWQRFAEEVPVTFVDGRRHAFWRVDAARLRAALTR